VEERAGSRPIQPRSGYEGLSDRDDVLASLTDLIAGAWESFERPRPEEPGFDAELEERLGMPLPEEPHSAEEALADAARILDESVSPARPLYLAYVGSTGLEVGVLAAALSAAYDVNLAVTARTADLVEAQALDWVAEFVGFPLAEGAFTSGGMTSNLTALLAARERALPGCRERGFGDRTGAIYCSEESHHSVVRAAEAIGLGSQAVRRIPLGSDRRLDVKPLEEAIALDREAGITPVAVVANGGTTLTGAVDDLEAIADVCEGQDTWFHVDGAYGLPAAATESAGPLFAGIERADSATLDAHKWLGIQKSCSVVMVARRGALEGTFGHEESYIRREEVPNAVERTLEYSRPFRSLKLWLAFRVHGAAAFRTAIERTLRLARDFAARVVADDQLELLCEPTLSTVCFRHVPRNAGSGFDLDAHNTRLAAAAQQDGRIYPAAAAVDGRTCIRVCFVNFRTAPADVELLLETVLELGDRLAGGDFA
jgi:aromatic-L-amino-acid decarboxylase